MMTVAVAGPTNRRIIAVIVGIFWHLLTRVLYLVFMELTLFFEDDIQAGGLDGTIEFREYDDVFVFHWIDRNISYRCDEGWLDVVLEGR